MLKRMCALIIGVVVLVACAAPEGATQSPVGENTTDVLAHITRSGGLQGKTETLSIGRDGSVTLLDADNDTTPPKTINVPQSELQALETALASSEWQQLEASYGQQTPDAFAYTITAGGKQVTTYDGAANPAVLDTVLRQVNSLWSMVEMAQ